MTHRLKNGLAASLPDRYPPWSNRAAKTPYFENNDNKKMREFPLNAYIAIKLTVLINHEILLPAGLVWAVTEFY